MQKYMERCIKMFCCPPFTSKICMWIGTIHFFNSNKLHLPPVKPPVKKSFTDIILLPSAAHSCEARFIDIN